MEDDLTNIQNRLARLKEDRKAIMAERAKAQEELKELQGSLERLRKNTQDKHQAFKDAQTKQEDHVRKQAERDANS